MWSSCIALALSLAITTSAQLVSYNAGNGISYALSVPETTAMTKSGPLFFQLAGPASYQWIGFGFGDGMAGSNIFVMWTDGAGNVTVSPRSGQGEFQPQYNSGANIQLLEGSGVVGDQMIANVMCTNCETWSGGTLDFTSTSSSFIHAHKTGTAINSKNANMGFAQHDNTGQVFTFDLTKASGGSSQNPFVTAASSTNSSAPATSGGAAVGAGGSSSSSSSDDSSASDNEATMLQTAHGVIMGLTVVILLPFGALLIRVLGFSGSVWAHAIWQDISLLLLTAGFGIGVVLAKDTGYLYEAAGKTHTIFGTVIFALFWLQPIGGFIHHLLYKKKAKRTPVSHVHIWLGRSLFICAIINGGLGLQLAADPNMRSESIGYGVAAGVVAIIYVVVVGMFTLRRGRETRSSLSDNESPKRMTEVPK